MNISKHSDNEIVIKKETEEVISLDLMNEERNSWIKTKENAEAHIAYYDNLILEAEKFNLKTKEEIESAVLQANVLEE